MTALALRVRRGWRPGSLALTVGGILTACLIGIALLSLAWTPRTRPGCASSRS